MAKASAVSPEEEEVTTDPLGLYDEGFSLRSVVVAHLGKILVEDQHASDHEQGDCG